MNVAFLTAGGIAPCLSSSIGRLIRNYSKQDTSFTMLGYLNGYKGLLTGESLSIGEDVIKNAEILYEYGGSPIGNSRVKLTNIDDCIKNGYIRKGEDPLKVAADQLVGDNVSILHTIGGDDTNISAGDLINYLKNNNYELTVVGLPKTIDNDIFPIQQTPGVSGCHPGVGCEDSTGWGATGVGGYWGGEGPVELRPRNPGSPGEKLRTAGQL